MRKLVMLCALVPLVASACAPGAAASSIADAERAIPVTYFPTSTSFPTWTPQPTQTPSPAPPTSTPLPEPPATEPPAVALAPEVPPEQPTATAEPQLILLPTLEATAVPVLVADTPVPTPIPVAVVEQKSAAFSVQSVPPASSCPALSSYDLVPIEGASYKNNTLTDENADLRLSVLGYTPASAPVSLVDYNGSTDPDAPKLHGLFEPNRLPSFVAGYKRLNWAWNEGGGPPYGSPGGANEDWPVSVVDLGTSAGETIYAPERGPVIYGGGVVALVLYAGERELTLAYTRQDSVGVGYVVHLMNFCVDANLVALYRANTDQGRRTTGQLPGVRNNQSLGVATGGTLTVAVRDRGAFLDPRSKKDWW